jgi:uncharacterized membrane protein YgcG
MKKSVIYKIIFGAVVGVFFALPAIFEGEDAPPAAASSREILEANYEGGLEIIDSEKLNDKISAQPEKQGFMSKFARKIANFYTRPFRKNDQKFMFASARTDANARADYGRDVASGALNESRSFENKAQNFQKTDLGYRQANYDNASQEGLFDYQITEPSSERLSKSKKYKRVMRKIGVMPERYAGEVLTVWEAKRQTAAKKAATLEKPVKLPSDIVAIAHKDRSSGSATYSSGSSKSGGASSFSGGGVRAGADGQSGGAGVTDFSLAAARVEEQIKAKSQQAEKEVNETAGGETVLVGGNSAGQDARNGDRGRGENDDGRPNGRDRDGQGEGRGERNEPHAENDKFDPSSLKNCYIDNDPEANAKPVASNGAAVEGAFAAQPVSSPFISSADSKTAGCTEAPEPLSVALSSQAAKRPVIINLGEIEPGYIVTANVWPYWQEREWATADMSKIGKELKNPKGDGAADDVYSVSEARKVSVEEFNNYARNNNAIVFSNMTGINGLPYEKENIGSKPWSENRASDINQYMEEQNQINQRKNEKNKETVKEAITKSE